MTEVIFDSQDKIDSALANFRQLKSTAGWQMLTRIVKGNMRVLEDQILSGSDEISKEQMDRKRDKLKAYKEVIETPDFIINKFEKPQRFSDDTDPFYTVDSLQDEKEKHRKSRQDTK